MLRYNFYLSKWLAGSKQDKIIPGTAFLFLNQVSFLFLDAFLISDKFLPFTLSPEIFTGLTMLIVFCIIFGLQKRVQLRIIESKYDKDFSNLTTKEIYKSRLIALLLFVLPFILCFIVAILLYR